GWLRCHISQDPPLSKHTAGSIHRARMDAPLLSRIADDFHRDLAETLVGIGLRIVGDSVRVAQVFADVFEGLHLLLPRLGPVGLAAGALGDAAKYAARDRVLIHFAGGDDVDRDALILGHRADV